MKRFVVAMLLSFICTQFTLAAAPIGTSLLSDAGKLHGKKVSNPAAAKDGMCLVFINSSSAYKWRPCGAASADQLSYTNPTYPNVAAALDQLLYSAPSSPSVSHTAGNQEVGATVTEVVLNWSITLGSAALTSQSIDNGIGSISTALRTYTHGGQTITANRTYVVSITDGTTPRTGSTTVAFYRRNHWEPSTVALADFTSADILAMASNEFASSHSKSVTYDCTGGRYPTFAYPASYGLLTATTVGGLSFSDYSYRTISHTNVSGSTVDYYVYQFNSIQTGAAIAVVWN